MKNCDICSCDQCAEEQVPDQHRVEHWSCPNCGEYFLDKAIRSMGWLLQIKSTAVTTATVSYAIRRKQSIDSRVELRPDWIENVLKNGELPSPDEQGRHAVLTLGNLAIPPGKFFKMRLKEFPARVGALDDAGVIYILKWLLAKNEIEEKSDMLKRAGDTFDPVIEIRLTPEGWERFGEIKRSAKDSRRAFMAMKFDDAELESMFSKFFCPAVEQTGFKLEKLNDRPKAGLIDIRMEVEIRNSRFVLADLTHSNCGVYWEAGFGTALGKPVIYTCRSDMKQEIHFDTNHRHYVEWDPACPETAVDNLKATIRATLPMEAKLED